MATVNSIPGGLTDSRIVSMQRLEQELRLASQAQIDLLPVVQHRNTQIDLDVRCEPARIIGGDFYDFVRYPGQGISAGALGDVSGKGAPAAIYAALIAGMMRSLHSQELSPKEMLRVLNRSLLQRPNGNHFVSLLYATWDERNRAFNIANSGLPYPIWIHKGQLKAVEVDGLPLGALDDAQYEQVEIRCSPGDTIVFFSDGITDAVNADEEDFDRSRLEQLVYEHRTDSAGDIVNAIFAAVEQHAGDAGRFDDQTVIVART